MRTQKVVSSFSSTSLKLQLIKDPSPQTIISVKTTQAKPKIKTQIRKQTINQSKKKKKQKLTQYQDPNPQVNTKSGLWLGFGGEETDL